MSERVGLDRSYLAEVETGKIEICLRNLELIATAFEMEVWQMLKLSSQRNRAKSTP
jgi:transcriptional regulator with XRE-family HTH domain